MIELNEQLKQALAANRDEPVRVIDSQTQQVFVLLRAEVYDKLKALVYDDSEFAVRQAYSLMDEVAAKAGWDDPEMDVYNDLAPGGGK
ncbi:MAG: hypothetical protein HY040_12890 [Planctomycetes bacterium]|nr:hypothetical protein [Planctomycetota bacterium]